MKTNAARNSDTRVSSITRRTYICTLFFVLTASFALLVFQRWLQPKTYGVCSALGESTIYTVDEARPKVECFVVRGKKIAWTGSEGEIERWRHWEGGPLRWVLQGARARLKVFHVKAGHSIVPGLADAHAHVLEYGWKMQLVLDGSDSVEEVLRRVKEYILTHPDVSTDKDVWIEGMGWDQTKWPVAQFPTASDFDREPLLRSRPIVLRRIDGHASWVSPRVLELMRPLPERVDGGDIVRDTDGNPTGVFIDNAILLIPTPEPSDAQMVEYFEIAMRDALKHGLTSIHDATVSPRQIHFFKLVAEEGRLPIRLYVMGHVPGSDKYWGSQISRLEDYGVHGRLNVRSIKLVADGALGSWGAALLEPYSDKPETSGLMLIAPSKLAILVKQFWKDGWQVNVHGIGDRANKIILDIFENLILEEGVDVERWRPRLEHAQIMTSDDLERIGRLGVLPSVQSTHATSDMSYAESRLGPERITGAYAYRSLLNSSGLGVLPLGSDFPIEGINPLLGFYAAVSRLSTSGTSPHGPSGWYPSEALTRAQALKGMTLDAAHAAFAERDLGSLTPGKKADFVVLDRDIMTVSIEQVLEARVKATVVDGELMFGGLE